MPTLGDSPASPRHSTVPESCFNAPLKMRINVLLPAPFSPITANTSPADTASVAPRRAGTPENDFARSRASTVSGTGILACPFSSKRALFNKLLKHQRWIQQRLNIGLGKIVFFDQGNTGVDVPGRLASGENLGHRLHAFVTHLVGILHHQRIEDAVLQILLQRG